MGKTYLACALDMVANRNFYTTKHIRLPDLLVEVAIVWGDGTYREYREKLKLLILDEWLLYPLKESEAKDVMELVEARDKTAPTIFCLQFDMPGWPEKLSDPLMADATCDRIIHDALHRGHWRQDVHAQAERPVGHPTAPSPTFLKYFDRVPLPIRNLSVGTAQSGRSHCTSK